jgi:catechol 2,3-dioxygenase-like lactoylglutathione lyase family enzyme
MLSDKTIMAFLAVSDADKARPFYEGVLGLPLKRTDPYAMVFDCHGIELRMSIIKSLQPAFYSVLSWMVTDMPGMVKGLQARGVVFERYEGVQQDELGIWTTPDGSQVAWFKDPDGNVLSLTQYAQHPSK